MASNSRSRLIALSHTLRLKSGMREQSNLKLLSKAGCGLKKKRFLNKPNQEEEAAEISFHTTSELYSKTSIRHHFGFGLCQFSDSLNTPQSRNLNPRAEILYRSLVTLYNLIDHPNTGY